jgi:predicted nucleic acid-binding protein
MKGFLIDTNVPSELTKERPDPRVASFLLNADKSLLHISVMTIGEIRKGIEALTDGAKKNSLKYWLKQDVRLWFAERILPVTEEIAERWGSISAAVKRRGGTLSVVDGLMAATAIEYKLTVVTRNVKDFSELNTELFNPWER